MPHKLAQLARWSYHIVAWRTSGLTGELEAGTVSVPAGHFRRPADRPQTWSSAASLRPRRSRGRTTAPSERERPPPRVQKGPPLRSKKTPPRRRSWRRCPRAPKAPLTHSSRLQKSPPPTPPPTPHPTLPLTTPLPAATVHETETSLDLSKIISRICTGSKTTASAKTSVRFDHSELPRGM